MENRFSYTLVGFFIVLFSLLLVIVSVWLAVGTEKRNYIQYKIVTSEAINGLSTNSNVDYLGVNVGKVAEITLDRDNPRLVTIILNIEDDIPVKEDTEAVFIARGITGLIGVSLIEGSLATKRLMPTEDNPIPRIKNGPPSFSKRVDEAINNVTTSVKELSSRLELLVNEENINSFNQTLTNIEAFTTTLNNNSAKLIELVENSTALTSEGTQLLNRGNQLIHSLETKATTLADSLTEGLTDLTDAGKEFKTLLNSWQGVATQADTTLAQLSPELSHLLVTLSTFMEELTDKASPLILGKSKERKGPGE